MNKKTPYLLLSPILLLILIFALGVLNGIIQSFGYIPAFDLTEISLKYYIDLIKDPSFLASLGVSLKIAVISSILSVIFGTLLAAALVYTDNTEGRALGIIKIAILVPHTIVALFTINILSQNGLIARFFYKLGLIQNQKDFPMLLYSSNNIGIILGYLWKQVPFVAYFSLSLMNSISSTLGEAAENLGASKLKSFFHITLPLTMPSIRKAFLIILTFSFAAYDLPFLLGATLPKALPIQAHVEYIHPDLRHRPYAMAMNGIILFITWLMAGSYYLISKKRNVEGDYNER